MIIQILNTHHKNIKINRKFTTTVDTVLEEKYATTNIVMNKIIISVIDFSYKVDQINHPI